MSMQAKRVPVQIKIKPAPKVAASRAPLKVVRVDSRMDSRVEPSPDDETVVFLFKIRNLAACGALLAFLLVAGILIGATSSSPPLEFTCPYSTQERTLKICQRMFTR